MNPQPPDLESGALPLELLAFLLLREDSIPPQRGWAKPILAPLGLGPLLPPVTRAAYWHSYFVSLWEVCLRHQRQYFFNSTLSGVFCLFFVVA